MTMTTTSGAPRPNIPPESTVTGGRLEGEMTVPSGRLGTDDDGRDGRKESDRAKLGDGENAAATDAMITRRKMRAIIIIKMEHC